MRPPQKTVSGRQRRGRTQGTEDATDQFTVSMTLEALIIALTLSPT
jgi:hypothetical protein